MTFISFQLRHHKYERRLTRTKTRHVQRTNSGGGSLGLGPMYELNSKFDFLILVRWGFRRRVGLRATSPYASPVPVTNLQRVNAQVSGVVRLLCENVVCTSSINWSLSAKT